MSLSVEKIEKYALQKCKSFAQFAESIGMSKENFQDARDRSNRSGKVFTLTKIMEITKRYNISFQYFFDDNIPISEDPEKEYPDYDIIEYKNMKEKIQKNDDAKTILVREVIESNKKDAHLMRQVCDSIVKKVSSINGIYSVFVNISLDEVVKGFYNSLHALTHYDEWKFNDLASFFDEALRRKQDSYKFISYFECLDDFFSNLKIISDYSNKFKEENEEMDELWSNASDEMFEEYDDKYFEFVTISDSCIIYLLMQLKEHFKDFPSTNKVVNDSIKLIAYDEEGEFDMFSYPSTMKCLVDCAIKHIDDKLLLEEEYQKAVNIIHKNIDLYNELKSKEIK